jgi:hypothetical protein
MATVTRQAGAAMFEHTATAIVRETSKKMASW